MANHNETASRNGGPVGLNILRLRRQQRITQKQLAEPEFSISYISAIERGRIRPSLKALDILAHRLGVSPAELLAEPPDDPQPESKPGSGGEETPPLQLPAMLRQRPYSQLALLALAWTNVYLAQGDWQRSRELLELLSPSAISAEQRLLCMHLLGGILLGEGRAADAQALLEPIFQQDEFNSHPQLLERCRLTIARAYAAQDKFLLASDAFSACVEAIEKGILPEPFFAIEVYSALAEHNIRLNRRDLAAQFYQQVLNQFEFVFNPTALAESSAQLSRKHLENVHSTAAEWHAARSGVLFELAGARQRFSQAALNLGLILQEQGNPQAAKQHLLQTIDFCERLGTDRQAILTRIALADMLLERQDASEAERFALEAQELCHVEQGKSEDEILYGRVLITLADANKALNRLDEAERYFEQAIGLLKEHQANDYLSQAYFRYSALLDQRGQHAEGYKLMTQAYLLSNRKPEAGG